MKGRTLNSADLMGEQDELPQVQIHPSARQSMVSTRL
jgi:hypothetical protein